MRGNVLCAYADEPPFHSELETLIHGLEFGVILTKVKSGIRLGDELTSDRLAASVALKVIVIRPRNILSAIDWMKSTRKWIHGDPLTVVLVRGFTAAPYAPFLYKAGAHHVFVASRYAVPACLKKMIEDVREGKRVSRSAPSRVLVAKTSLFARNIVVSVVNVLSP